MMTMRTPETNERLWQNQVLDIFEKAGWEPSRSVYHTWTSIHSVKGFPDLVAVFPHKLPYLSRRRLLYAELKSEQPRSIVTADQVFWLDCLTEAREEVYLWRPSDVEEIAHILFFDGVHQRPAAGWASAWANRRAAEMERQKGRQNVRVGTRKMEAKV